MRVKVLAIALCCFLFSNVGSCEELTLEKKAAIKELLEVTGAVQIYTQFADAFSQGISQALRKANPDIDPRAFDFIREESTAVMREEFVSKTSFLDLVIPVYNRYLTLEEINGLIRFYKTPLGMKTISILPELAQEGKKASQTLAQLISPKLHQRILDRLRKEGIDTGE